MILQHKHRGVSDKSLLYDCLCLLLCLQDDRKEGDDEDKYAEDMDMPGQKFETKNRITVRNLRIREDTAKVRLVLNQWVDLACHHWMCFVVS